MDDRNSRARFEHSEQVVVRHYKFAGRLMARPVRELTATMRLDGSRLTSTLDVSPTLNELALGYYRRQLEDTLWMRAEMERLREPQKVWP